VIALLKSPVAGFVVRVLAWLPPLILVWYLAAPTALVPVRLIVAAGAHAAFGSLVQSVDQHAAVATFVTTLRPGSAGAAGVITVDVDMLLYTFGLPLYAAMVVAAREPRWPSRLALGLLALLPLVAFGVVADFLRNVAITAGPLVASQTGFSAWQREAIAFSYQFGSLILPTVAPAVAWVASHRLFLERLRRRA
jgi:hypothetical protein